MIPVRVIARRRELPLSPVVLCLILPLFRLLPAESLFVHHRIIAPNGIPRTVVIPLESREQSELDRASRNFHFLACAALRIDRIS